MAKEKFETGVMEFAYQHPERSEIDVRKPPNVVQSFTIPEERKKVLIV